MNRVTEFIIGVSVGVGLVMGLMWLPPVPAVQAQSSRWEVIAQPESVGDVKLSVVRHVSTRQCLIIATSSNGVAFERTNTFSGDDNPCETPEEREARERRWETISVDDIPASFRMFDERVQSSAQPAVGQTSKQPGVPQR